MIVKGHIGSLDQIHKINEVASKESFDISIHCCDEMYDAKSFIALFNLVGKDVKIVTEDWVDKKYFKRIVKKMGF